MVLLNLTKEEFKFLLMFIDSHDGYIDGMKDEDEEIFKRILKKLWRIKYKNVEIEKNGE